MRIDLLRKYFRSEIFRFRVRRSKNYEAYTAYMLNNFCKAVAEIWKLQQKNIYAVGLIHRRENNTALRGFTLIELVIYLGIAGGVLLTFTFFILHIVSTRNKTLAVNEVQTSGRIALAAISARIRNATGVNAAPASIFGSDPGVLSLRMDDFPAQNPTIIRLSGNNGFLQIQEGTGPPIQITSPLVRVTNLTFSDLPSADVKKNILVNLKIEYGDPLEPQNDVSLWSSATTIGIGSFSDLQAVELGVRFTSDTAGFIRGIRFYKGPTNTGTHVGHLWASTGGAALGTVTFTDETFSGWQEAFFSSPIAINANTPYIASYYAPSGNYATNNLYFATTGVDTPPLHAPADTALAHNGVYAYVSDGPFPFKMFNFQNYWVDVVFTTQLPSTAQRDAGFVHSQIWEATVNVRQQTDISFWSPYAAPVVTAFETDPSPVELGIRFTSDVAGFIRGIRFYKGNTNTSTHTGRLWASTGGAPLGTVTFTGETASGWQEAFFSSPIAIAANTTYVASYRAPNGNYASDTNYFATVGIDKPPLHAPANISPNSNGVYVYDPPGGFPNQTFNSQNYWVDVVFSTTP